MKNSALQVFSVASFIAVALIACTNVTPEQRIQSAKDYLKHNDAKSAVIQMKDLLQNNPNLAEARYVLGTALLRQGDVAGAELEFRKALEAKYQEDLVIPELASSMLSLGKEKILTQEFGKKQLGPATANANLQTTLALAYDRLRKPELAEAALTTALRSDPGYSPALLIRARQKASERDFGGALQAVDAILSKDAANAEAWKLKGDILYGSGRTEDSLTAYRKSVEVEPHFLTGHAAIITVLMEQHRLDDASKQLEELKKVAATSGQTMYLETQLALLRKDYKLAHDLSQRLLKIDANNTLYLQVAGAVALRLNTLTQAEQYLSKALVAEPRLALARRLLVATYVRSGQFERAISAINDAARNGVIEPGLIALAGEVYLQKGDPAEAERHFRQALTLDPNDVRSRTDLAMAQLSAGKTDIALQELQDIANSDSGTTADLALISTYAARKQFKLALAAVDKLESKQPANPMTANLRGRIYLAQKDNAAARKSFEQALAIDRTYFAAAVNLAALDVADKKPDDAKKRFEEVLAKDPGNGQAWVALAELAAFQGGGKAEVAPLLRKAVEVSPSELKPRLLLIELNLSTSDFREAVNVAQSAAATLPDNPEVLAALGRAQQAAGDLNQAIATYGKLATIQPRSPAPWMMLSAAQLAAKNTKEAERSLRKILEFTPDHLEAQRRLIALLLDVRKYQDATNVARQVQSQRPKSSAGFALEGDINAKQKQWDAAASAYRAGLSREPSSVLAAKLHTVLVASGKNSDAEAFANGWMNRYPKEWEFLFHLGDAAIATGDYAAAERNLRAALQIQPNNSLTLNNLAWATFKQGKDGALAYAQKADQLTPNQPFIMDTLAILLTDKGEYSKAIALQRQAIELQPGNASLRLSLARIYLASGDKALAKTELESIAKVGPANNPVYSEVMALLRKTI